MSDKIKNALKNRKGEQIGGGFFVFRRGNGTGRVRPSVFPFEHPDLRSAIDECGRMAKLQPGYKFEVFGSVHDEMVEIQEATQ